MTLKISFLSTALRNSSIRRALKRFSKERYSFAGVVKELCGKSNVYSGARAIRGDFRVWLENSYFIMVIYKKRYSLLDPADSKIIGSLNSLVIAIREKTRELLTYSKVGSGINGIKAIFRGDAMGSVCIVIVAAVATNIAAIIIFKAETCIFGWITRIAILASGIIVIAWRRRIPE